MIRPARPNAGATKHNRYSPTRRGVFHQRQVCEGCGDCGVKSNCVSVMPLETEFGRKRTIDQSNCNKRFLLRQWLRPSFVTVEGGALKKPKKVGADAAADFGDLPTPAIPELTKPFNMLVTGIGGTGVLTVGQVLGMAASSKARASPFSTCRAWRRRMAA